jgi:hypothetical protein
VSAHGNDESDAFDSQAADHEDGTLHWIGEEHERGNGEKESGWHDQQSGVFHGYSFLSAPGTFHQA